MLSSGPCLYIGGRRLFVVVGVDDFFAAVRQIAQDTNDVFDTFVVHVVLIDGASHQVKQGFDHTLLQPQSLSGFDSGRAHIPNQWQTNLNARKAFFKSSSTQNNARSIFLRYPHQQI